MHDDRELTIIAKRFITCQEWRIRSAQPQAQKGGSPQKHKGHEGGLSYELWFLTFVLQQEHFAHFPEDLALTVLPTRDQLSPSRKNRTVHSKATKDTKVWILKI
jgi:hypothetical protein